MSEIEAAAATSPEVAAVNADKENENETNVAETGKTDKEAKDSGNGTNGFKWEDAKNLYEFTVKDIDGNEVATILLILQLL